MTTCYEFEGTRYLWAGLPKRRHDKHHPRPLCIDGRAYHQKRRNRRKP